MKSASSIMLCSLTINDNVETKIVGAGNIEQVVKI